MTDFAEGDEEGITPEPKGRKRPPRKTKAHFAPLPISETFLTLMHEHAADVTAVAEATFYAQRDTAYSRLNLTRKTMAEYVAGLEKRLGIKQSALVKF